MEIVTQFDKKAKIRIHRVKGIVKLQSLLQTLKGIYSASDFQADLNSLWDMREADISSFVTADVEQVRDLVGKFWGTGGESRSALVVTGNFEFGLSRMYELLLQSKTTSEVQVFRDLDKAKAWLAS